MLRRAIASNLITRPAIWGKVPAHADFVSSGVRNGEREEWEAWLAAQSRGAAERPILASANLPACFVLPPGAMRFAPRRYVLGVVARSMDRLGRPYALLVYQLAHPRWLVRHFENHAACPHDWLFWLARAVARHAGLFEAADIGALERVTAELWRLHAPNASAFLPGPWRAEHDPATQVSRSRALLNRLMGAASQDDLARRLAGVRFLPWPDWPERLFCASSAVPSASVRPPMARSFEGAFWQQDDAGRFVNAAVRLDTLWHGSP